MFTHSSRAHKNGATRTSRLAVTAAAVVAASTLAVCAFAAPALAASPNGPTNVDLGTATGFSVLAAAAATLPGSNLLDEAGARAAITDDANTVYGSARHTVNDVSTQAALADAMSAYTTLSNLAPTGPLSGDDLTLQVVTPGVYHRVAAYAMTTPVTFDAQGNPDAYFIMQSDAALNTTAGSWVNLVGGAQASHIFWVVRGAATLGASSNFTGTILSYAAVTVGATSRVCGRAFSVMAAVTLDADNFYCSFDAPAPKPPVPAIDIAIAGAPTASVMIPTPMIWGTSSASNGSAVVVTVAGQTLKTTVQNGIWKVKPAALKNGSYVVWATVTDVLLKLTKADNMKLTVGSLSMGLAITTSSTTNCIHPVIAGTSTGDFNSVVTLVIDGKYTFTALVTANHTWTVKVLAPALSLGNHTLVATTVNKQGTTARAEQTLLIVPINSQG